MPIYDAFGRLVSRRNKLLTPDWVTRECAKILNQRVSDVNTEMLLSDLRDSIGVEDVRVGETIHVALPQRYR